MKYKYINPRELCSILPKFACNRTVFKFIDEWLDGKHDTVGLQFNRTPDEIALLCSPNCTECSVDSREDGKGLLLYDVATQQGWNYSEQVLKVIKSGKKIEGHSCYIHSLDMQEGGVNTPERDMTYTGITSKNWLIRLKQHHYEVSSGRGYRFHQTWRDLHRNYAEKISVIYRLCEVNKTFEEAMDWEEREAQVWPKGLNVLPGGFAGLRYMNRLRHEYGHVTSVDEKDDAIESFLEENPGTMERAQKLAELWNDPDHYFNWLKSIDGALEPHQVFEVRHLYGMGDDYETIVEKVGARNVGQVRRIIKEQTYRRIH